MREHIIDGMCCLAQSLEGAVPELLQRVSSGGHLLVQELATFLNQAKEVLWVQVCPVPCPPLPPSLSPLPGTNQLHV